MKVTWHIVDDGSNGEVIGDEVIKGEAGRGSRRGARVDGGVVN